MPESSPDKTKQEPPKPPEPDKEKEALAAAANEAQRRASIAEQQAAYNRGIAEAAIATRQPAPQRQQVVDPLDRWSQEDLTLPAEDKKRMLDQAMRMRAAEMANVTEQRVEQRLQAERANMENKMALDMVTMTRPELQKPENIPLFGAALTKVKMEADARGERLSSSDLAQRAAMFYDQTFKPQSQKLPFTEGANRGEPIGQQTPQEPESVSFLEKKYGMKKGKIQPMFDIEDHDQVDALNGTYLLSRNKRLIDKGVNSGMREVWATVEEK